MYRVLRPDGVLGVRTADRDGYLMTPSDPILEAWALRGEQEKLAQGVHVRIGKKLRSFLRQAGFVDVEASASYDCCGTAESVLALGEAMAKRADKAAQAGDQEAAEIAAAWRRWGQSPDAFAAQSLCEAIGIRSEHSIPGVRRSLVRFISVPSEAKSWCVPTVHSCREF
jgi:hypothetical protein